jgi:hypothetical protein
VLVKVDEEQQMEERECGSEGQGTAADRGVKDVTDRVAS